MPKYHALFIGINEYLDSSLKPLKYSEKDCDDLLNVLTQEETGCLSCFSETNIEVIKGEEATTQRIKDALFSLISDKGKDDVILVYFSGHGFHSEFNDSVFIASYDVDLQKLNQTRNPERGISMEFLYNKIYLGSEADHTIIILDCCFSGSLIQIPQFQYQPVSNGHARYALLSSSPYEVSREDENLENSQFTHKLIQALSGDAASEETGEVTIQDLCEYLSRELYKEVKIDVHEPPHLDPVMLTKPGAPLEILSIKKRSGFEQPISPHLAGHHLDSIPVYLDQLIEIFSVKPKRSVKPLVIQLLDSIKTFLTAKLVIVFEDKDQHWNHFYSDFSSDGCTVQEYIKSIEEYVLRVFASEDIRTGRSHGFKYPGELSSDSFWIIPLRKKGGKHLVICEPQKDIPHYAEDIVSELCVNFYNEIVENNWAFPAEILLFKAAIIDKLRETFGFLPYDVYEKRFDIFKQSLSQIQMWFQPIVRLNSNPRFIEIEGWEALARDPKTKRVPRNLLHAAELWGPQFQIELDIYCLNAAVKTYADLTLPEKNASNLKPLALLSVNAFPSSLLNDSYYEAVKNIVDFGIFPGEKLIIEISEKRELPDSFSVFQNRLNRYNREFNIGFAVDDFGVGHSSVSRLASLALNHIKLDSAIAKQEHNEITIQYVSDLVSEKISSSKKIILEGYDKDSSLNLSILAKYKLRYIQGHLIGEARPDLITLDSSKRKELASNYRVQ